MPRLHDELVENNILSWRVWAIFSWLVFSFSIFSIWSVFYVGEAIALSSIVCVIMFCAIRVAGYLNDLSVSNQLVRITDNFLLVNQIASIQTEDPYNYEGEKIKWESVVVSQLTGIQNTITFGLILVSYLTLNTIIFAVIGISLRSETNSFLIRFHDSINKLDALVSIQ